MKIKRNAANGYTIIINGFFGHFDAFEYEQGDHCETIRLYRGGLFMANVFGLDIDNFKREMMRLNKKLTAA